MATATITEFDLRKAADDAVRELVSINHWGDASYVSLPLVNPDGSSATIRIRRAPGGFRVDDAGFAYRDLERLGAGRTFARVAKRVAEKQELEVTDGMIAAFCAADELSVAIMDVGRASWSVLDIAYERLNAEEAEIEAGLRERLVRIFEASVDDDKIIPGISTNPWEVSAIIHQGNHIAVFQAVANHANSIYRASAAFHDLAALPIPPTLVSVVKNRKALGTRLSLLAQAGRVIEYDQADEIFQRAAA